MTSLADALPETFLTTANNQDKSDFMCLSLLILDCYLILSTDIKYVSVRLFIPNWCWLRLWFDLWFDPWLLEILAPTLSL